MGDRSTNVHTDLTTDQRARLCIVTELIDVSTTELDGFDLLRYAHWVGTGKDPDSGIEVAKPLSPDAATWSPAVQ
jgi:hypothetical protein